MNQSKSERPSLLHQIVSLLSRRPSGELALADGAEEALRVAFQEASPSAALRDEVVELVSFAVFVGEKEGSTQLARTLLDIACEATPSLEKLAEVGDLRRADSHDRAKTLLGQSRDKRAPQVSDRAPEGTVRPSSFILRQPQKIR